MKRIAPLIAVTIMFASFLVAQPEKVSRIRITVPDKTALDRVWAAGIDYCGVTGKIGGPMEFVAGQFEMEQLSSRGVSYQIVVDDLMADYLQHSSPGAFNALGFGYGSMGGHYTYAEMNRQLDTMKLQYPNLITDKMAIGLTREGRTIWAAKISSNPAVNDPTKPEVLYTGIHHAREPMGIMSIAYYMWWLLENYGTNPDATYLVNNRQMWFVPIMNVDGYEYNRSIAPTGGGNWRKNRRNNGDGTFGVDLNRNYGPFYMWNSTNGGSSTSTGSDTYRGTAPFSEPENRAIDTLMRNHNFKACLNYHTFGSYLIYPWGWASRENGDSLIYRDWAYEMTVDNRSTNGTDVQTVNYATRGGSDDYMFGDTTKPQTYSMTPEVGIDSDGFWAPQNRILPLAQANLRMNRMLAFIAGGYPHVRSFRIQDANGNGHLERGENFSLVINLKNRGLATVRSLTMTLSANVRDISFTTGIATLDSLPMQAQTDVAFAGRISPTATTGVPVQAYLVMEDARGFSRRDTLNLYVGIPAVVFADSASSGTGNWTTGTGWGLTSNAHTPPNAFTDSPSGPYPANTNNSLTLTTQLSLTGFNFAQLKFWTKWAIEPTWDFATVEISSNNGSSWTTLRTELSHGGSARSGSAQPAGTWGFDSYTPLGQTWIEQTTDLTAYVNRQIKIRFRVAADAGEQRDGFYVDDIRVLGYTTDVLPDTGIVTRPTAFNFTGLVGRVFRDSLTIKNFTGASIQVNLAESTLTAVSMPTRQPSIASLDFSSLLARLRPAFRQAKITAETLKRLVQPTGMSPATEPNAFTTIITDERGETVSGAVDIYRVQHQLRTGLTTYHDFKVVLGNLPDDNVISFISVDTDQDFGTGTFPAPLRLGPTSRDIGSEREVVLDASGTLLDSLTGFRIPAGIVLNSTVDSISIVGAPFLLTVTHDSVFTINTQSILGGVRQDQLGDTDGKMNVGVLSARLLQGANPFPDFAPVVGHGTVGAESGVSWLSEDRQTATIANGDSATIRLIALAARSPGAYNAALRINAAGRAPVFVPMQLNVSGVGVPRIIVSPTSFRDTLRLGDSTMNRLTISNTGNGDLVWGMVDTSNTSWLGVGGLYGTIAPGAPASTVAFTVRTTGLTAGQTYNGRVLVISNDPSNNSVAVPVSVRVTPPNNVARNENPIPASFALRQNYPNPFNPETNITLDVPRSSFVTLKVYNVIGQEVATVVSQQLPAGTYDFKVGKERYGLATGVYLYKMIAGGFVQTRKMILLR